MLKNAYLLAKIGADTAENGRKFAETVPKIGNYPTGSRLDGQVERGAPPGLREGLLAEALERRGASRGRICCESLAGSFSAVSKRNFARKYAFGSIFQALQDLHTLHHCNLKILAKNRFEKSAIFVKIQQKFCRCCKTCKILPNLKNFS